jgi:hypothetical protein
VDAHCVRFFSLLGIFGRCGDFRAQLRPQTPGSSHPGIQPSRPEERAGSYRPPGIAYENTPNTEVFVFSPDPNFNIEDEDVNDQIKKLFMVE